VNYAASFSKSPLWQLWKVAVRDVTLFKALPANFFASASRTRTINQWQHRACTHHFHSCSLSARSINANRETCSMRRVCTHLQIVDTAYHQVARLTCAQHYCNTMTLRCKQMQLYLVVCSTYFTCRNTTLLVQFYILLCVRNAQHY
jgi:hypothetical protein